MGGSASDIQRVQQKNRRRKKRKYKNKEVVQVKGRRTESKIKSAKKHTDNSTYGNYK